MEEIDSLPIHKQGNERRIGQRVLLNISLSHIHEHLIGPLACADPEARGSGGPMTAWKITKFERIL